MPERRNEVSYYPEIQNFIEAQLKSNFIAMHHRNIYVFWGIGELKTNLQRIVNENPTICNCVRSFMRSVPPLNLDIFALITDGTKFQLLILEVKLMSSVGLKEWSQLVGYCLVSNAKYGLLINIDNGASRRLNQILSTESHLSKIVTIVNENESEHNLGCMQWDSLTNSFDYSNLGCITSISALCENLSKDF